MKTSIFLTSLFLLSMLSSCNQRYKGYKEVFDKDGIIILRNEDSVNAALEANRTKPITPSNYQCLKEYNSLLVERVQQQIDRGESILGLNDFPVLIKMPTKGITSLIDGTDTLLAVFGIDNSTGTERLTVGFCRYDEKLQGPDQSHIDGYLNADETWPDETITFFSPTLNPDERGRIMEERLPTGKTECHKMFAKLSDHK